MYVSWLIPPVHHAQMLFKVDTDSWQVGFYSLTLGFALLFNMSDSVFQVL